MKPGMVIMGIEIELFQGTYANTGNPCNRLLTDIHIFFDLPYDYRTGGNCCTDEY